MAKFLSIMGKSEQSVKSKVWMGMGTVVGAVAYLLLTGCTVGMAPPVGGQKTGTYLTAQAALNADVVGNTDVGGMEFEVTRVSCNGETIEQFSHKTTKDLEDVRLPGNLSGFGDNPLDKNSSHVFSDSYITLPEGCYDVTVRPITKGKQPSKQCTPASSRGVRVEDGKTTEIVLLVQCKNDPVGGLDTVAVVNHEPQLKTGTGLVYKPSKFVQTCQEVEVCATVIEPDKDPVTFTWVQVGGSPSLSFYVSSTTQNAATKEVTQCIRMTTQRAGSYQFKVTAYDMVHEGGKLVRMEDYLTRRNKQYTRSHDELTFPVYVVER